MVTVYINRWGIKTPAYFYEIPLIAIFMKSIAKGPDGVVPNLSLRDVLFLKMPQSVCYFHSILYSKTCPRISIGSTSKSAASFRILSSIRC